MVATLGGSRCGRVIVAAILVYWRSNQLLAQRIGIDRPALNGPSDAAAVERSKRLANRHGCTECHGSDPGRHVMVDSFPVGRTS
ncbi:MAG: hypothetical protein WBV39_06670 [Rudaea sp.]